MKVYIGPYRDWIGPYQLADFLKYVGISEDRCHNIGEWLSDTWVCNFCEWIYSKKKRNINVKLHKYDTWGFDHTLALIILPGLIQLKATKHGAPLIDDEDVPEAIRSTTAKPKENEWDIDDNHFLRWDWILDELIWTFEQLCNEDSESQFYTGESSLDQIIGIAPGGTLKADYEALKLHDERIKKGLKLFGKYYRGLWD